MNKDMNMTTLLACLEVNWMLPFIPFNYVFQMGFNIVKHVKYVLDIDIYITLLSSDPTKYSINILYSLLGESLSV